jgi:hypothetical protein
VHLATALLLLPILVPSIGQGDDSSTKPPPVFLGAARSVTTRDSAGGVTRLTSIPSTSEFARYGGGSTKTCTITAHRNGFRLSDGTTVAKGTVITSSYRFVEGIAAPFDLPPVTLPGDVLGLETKGPLDAALRTFSVFCDSAYSEFNFRGLIQVRAKDPLLDPRRRVTDLRNKLQLIRPTVFENPLVAEFGGLVTRYPSWLAIGPEAWVTQRSNVERYRGATLALIAVPKKLEFVVSFVPNPAKPSTPFAGIVSCVPGVAATSDARALPAFPVLPDQTLPGVNGPCMWTPPGPGSVTVTARIVYDLTFWVSGYTERLDDYVWSSAPATFLTGELRAVNTKP